MLLPEEFASALSGISAARRGIKVVSTAEAEPSETAFRRVHGGNRPCSCSTFIDVALMTFRLRFILLDSGYEGIVEETLLQKKQFFIIPLRYDGEEDVFPDFVLRDVADADALSMEGFGINTPEYQLRKQEKCAHHDAKVRSGALVVLGGGRQNGNATLSGCLNAVPVERREGD